MSEAWAKAVGSSYHPHDKANMATLVYPANADSSPEFASMGSPRTLNTGWGSCELAATAFLWMYQHILCVFLFKDTYSICTGASWPPDPRPMSPKSSLKEASLKHKLASQNVSYTQPWGLLCTLGSPSALAEDILMRQNHQQKAQNKKCTTLNRCPEERGLWQEGRARPLTSAGNVRLEETRCFSFFSAHVCKQAGKWHKCRFEWGL